MVSAFAGYDVLFEAYKVAIKEKYNFGTYGDANVDYFNLLILKTKGGVFDFSGAHPFCLGLFASMISI